MSSNLPRPPSVRKDSAQGVRTRGIEDNMTTTAATHVV